MVINLSLSILVDGSIIREATIIINNDGKKIIHCYPCNVVVDVTVILHDLALELVKKNILKTLNSYIALIASNKGIIAIPISENRTLSIQISAPFLYRRITKELLSALNALANAVTN